jgi:hypothetical protein
MPKGYSLLMAEEIKSADPKLLGVKLGRVCLNKDIPVSDVADFFDVSRMTIYSWFRGKSVVSSKYAEKVNKILAKFK